ncbi:hypothetical protein CF326_g8248 [Tilletia indica]|nr:hypothetical protein CF326_g8248 [Tilletia indica]
MLAREQFKKRRSPPGGFGRSRAALELSNIFLRHLRGGTKEEVDKILNDPEANHYGVCIQPLTLVATDFDETNTDLEAQQAKGLELCSQIKPQQEQLVIAQYHLNRTKSSAAKSIADERQRKDVWVEELWVALGEEERGRRVVEQHLDKHDGKSQSRFNSRTGSGSPGECCAAGEGEGAGRGGEGFGRAAAAVESGST